VSAVGPREGARSSQLVSVLPTDLVDELRSSACAAGARGVFRGTVRPLLVPPEAGELPRAMAAFQEATCAPRPISKQRPNPASLADDENGLTSGEGHLGRRTLFDNARSPGL